MRIFKISLLFLLLFPGIAQAFPIAASGTEGLKVFVNSTDDIIAKYQGNSAAYSNDLYFGLTMGNTNTFIFNNQSTIVGTTANLGSFAIGTELIFRLHVNNTGYDFYTGGASRNPDNQIHARVQENWMPNETLVSFEDLFNGPFNYNDLSFSFTNTASSTPGTQVPEPATMFLLGVGLIGLTAVRKRVKR